MASVETVAIATARWLRTPGREYVAVGAALYDTVFTGRDSVSVRCSNTRESLTVHSTLFVARVVDWDGELCINQGNGASAQGNDVEVEDFRDGWLLAVATNAGGETLVALTPDAAAGR